MHLESMKVIYQNMREILKSYRKIRKKDKKLLLQHKKQNNKKEKKKKNFSNNKKLNKEN